MGGEGYGTKIEGFGEGSQRKKGGIKRRSEVTVMHKSFGNVGGRERERGRKEPAMVWVLSSGSKHSEEREKKRMENVITWLTRGKRERGGLIARLGLAKKRNLE